MTVAPLLAAALLAPAPAPPPSAASRPPASRPVAFRPAASRPVASRYVQELPVMEGLWESGSGFVFPVASGARLAETRLLGRVGDVEVRAFYARALPGAGWRQAPGAPYAFRRGRERLVLHVAPHLAGGGVLTEAVFVVTPDAAATAASHSRKERP
jgi:hypothetical protein